jgi:hypothetical protein
MGVRLALRGAVSALCAIALVVLALRLEVIEDSVMWALVAVGEVAKAPLKLEEMGWEW